MVPLLCSRMHVLRLAACCMKTQADMYHLANATATISATAVQQPRTKLRVPLHCCCSIRGMEMDIAVDPLDGTTLTAQGRNGAVSVSTAVVSALAAAGQCCINCLP